MVVYDAVKRIAKLSSIVLIGGANDHFMSEEHNQGSKLAGARVHGAPRNLAVHPSFKSWVHAVHPVISAQWQTKEADCTYNNNDNNLENH